MAEIALKHVYKKFDDGVEAIKDFNLEIEENEFVVFVGPSGCGKSTTLRMIAGLETITDGDLYIDGKRMNDIKAADRDFAMVFQNYALYPHMSVEENIGYSLKIAKVSKAERKKQVQEVAKILGLTEVLDRKPKELSGGQKQRVAMGRAIVRKPKAFLMDEPLSNLDAKLRTKMRVEIKKLYEMLGTTFIYVTHDQTEAMTLGTKIVVMKDGVIQQVASPKELYEKPENTFVAQFIGIPQMNLMRGKVYFLDGKYSLRIGEDYLALTPEIGEQLQEKQVIGEEIYVGVRPEDICVIEDGSMEAVVDVYELLGAESYLYFQYQDKKMCARVGANVPIAVGDKIRFTFYNDKIHFFDGYRETMIL